MDSTDKKIQNNNSLHQIIACVPQGHIPPLTQWTPKRVTPFDIVIDDDGTWYHQGDKISRQSLVNLFASVLWAETDGEQTRHFLKTPTDKYEISVIDVPLFINTIDVVHEQGKAWIVFGTTTGDAIVLDDKPLYFKTFTKDGIIDERLYIDTRFGLTARINRNVFYHLIELGELMEVAGQTVLCLKSGDKLHHIGGKSA